MTEVDQEIQARHIKGAIEALLFVNERPITVDQLKKVLQTVSIPEIKKFIKELAKEYNERQSGIAILEIADGYQMLTNATYAEYIKAFYKSKHKDKLSKPALETLAILAYKQPVTRADIEMIRGVNSDGVVAHLLEKELIKMVGRKEVPGRPFLYGTTKQFLEYFGLKSLDVLPNLEELDVLQPSAEGEEKASDTGVPQEAISMSPMEVEKQKAIAAVDDQELIAKQEIREASEESEELNALEESGSIEAEEQAAPGETDNLAETKHES